MNKSRTLKCILILFTINSFSGFSPIEYDLRPDYNLVNLRPSGFEPKVADLAWLSNGQLVVVKWADHKEVHNRIFEGVIYLLDGVQNATGPQDVTVNTFKTEIEDPTGVTVINDTIYTSGGYYLMAHIDSDNNGVADAADTIFNWGYDEKCRHEFFHGLEYQEGYFYTNASRCKDDPNRPSGAYSNTWQKHAGRGGFYKISKATGEVELIAGGLRSPYGMGVGPLGDIFQPDNQGSWLPSSKLIHPKKGRFYGFHADNFTPEQDYGPEYVGVTESPPALWLPHAQISHSPGHPILIHDGVFKNQMLMGDVAYGGIQRIFLEMVDGEWQGAAFNWTGGLEAGPGTLLWGNDGSLYVGGTGIGDQNNWGWRGTTSGLQKLVPVPNAPVVFEIHEVRSRSGGMEMKFTKAVNAGAGIASNYTMIRSEQRPIRTYGAGNNQGAVTVNITNATVSPDGKSVYLETNMNQLRGGSSLIPNSVVDIQLNNNIKSENGDDLWIARSWYTLNAISTSDAFDVNGCTDPNYAEYNPDATFEDGTCRSPISSVKTKPVFYERIRSKGNIIYVSTLEGGNHSVQLLTLDGKLIETRKGYGEQDYQFGMKNKKGVFLVRIINKKASVFQKVSIL